MQPVLGSEVLQFLDCAFPCLKLEKANTKARILVLKQIEAQSSTSRVGEGSIKAT